MKAIHEVGAKKASSYLFFSCIETIYYIFVDILFSPPPIRKIFLQSLGSKIGKSSVIMKVKFFNMHHAGYKGLNIGNECFVGDETLIDLYDNVILEDQVTVAQRVTILTHLNVGYKDHPLQKYFPKISKPVVLKKGCVIGATSTILPGVVVGQKTFVAAGSVVTKSIPSSVLAAGVPAKVIRRIKE